MVKLPRCFRLVALAGAALLALGGCGSSPEGRSLEEITGLPESAAERDALERDLFNRAEESVAACMAQAGFQYVPRTANQVQVVQSDDVQSPGYGITSQLIARMNGDLGAAPAPRSDPNRELLQTMTDEARDAWVRALEGFQPISSEATSEEILDPFRELEVDPDGGCRSVGRQDAQDQLGIDPTAITALERSLAGVESDPRVVTAVDEWSECMKVEGYSFRTENEIRTAISDEGFAIVQEANLRPGEDVPISLLADLDRVLDREVTVHRAATECAVDLQQILAMVRKEYEAIFVAGYDAG